MNDATNFSPERETSPPPLDTREPMLVAAAQDTRRSIATTAIIFLLFVTVGATTQLMNAALGIWFTELFIFLGVAWVRLNASGKDPVRYAGLTLPGWQVCAFGFALGVANFFALVIPTQFLAQSIAPPAWRDQWDMTNLFKNQTPLELGAIIGAVVLAAPFCEEFVFRGMLQRGLSQAISPRSAAVLSAIIFSAFHLDPVGFAARLELGIVFGFLFLRTGSLWPGVLAHAANNLISTVLYFGFNGDQAADIERPSWSAVFTVALFGLAVLAGLVAVARREPSVLARAVVPPGDSLTESAPRRSAVRPWAMGALATLVLFAMADRRGLILGWYDLAYRLPPLGKGASEQQKIERQELDALRKQARAGKVPLEAYRALREELFRRTRRMGAFSSSPARSTRSSSGEHHAP